MSGSDLQPLPVNKLNEICSRSMYTIDGLWFQAVEAEFGFETAFALNQKVWARCSEIHGKRMLKNLKLTGKTPFEKLDEFLSADPLTVIHNKQVVKLTGDTMVMRLRDCSIQVARIKLGKGVYNGKPACSLYFGTVAKLTDPRIETTCVSCAPHPENPEYWCEWQFTINGTK